MSTHDLDIANANGSTFRTDLNNALKALGTAMSAATSPALTPAVGQIWLDTTSSPYKFMMYNGSAYTEIFRYTSAGLVTVAGIGSVVQGYDAATAKYNIVNAYTRQQTFTAVSLTDQATISWNLDTDQVAKVTIAGNRTLAAPTNMKDGGSYILRVKQDATGGRTLSWNAAYKFIGGTPVISTAANALDIFTFTSDGTSMFCTGYQQGF